MPQSCLRVRNNRCNGVFSPPSRALAKLTPIHYLGSHISNLPVSHQIPLFVDHCHSQASLGKSGGP